MTTAHRLRLSPSAQAAIDNLPESQRDTLNTLIAQAEQTQRTQIETAVESAMAVIPAPFRKRVRKMIVG